MYVVIVSETIGESGGQCDAGSTPDWEGYRGGSPGCNFLGYRCTTVSLHLQTGGRERAMLPTSSHSYGSSGADS